MIIKGKVFFLLIWGRGVDCYLEFLLFFNTVVWCLMHRWYDHLVYVILSLAFIFPPGTL